MRRKLIELQYERNDQILQRGKFRHKGDVLEIFPAYLEEAYRIQLDWDEVSSIQRINPVTGGVEDEMETLFVYPAKHFVMPESQLQQSVGGDSRGAGGAVPGVGPPEPSG